MPLWRVFHAPSAFTPELKKSFAAAVTELYTAPPVSLPAFYVNVVFIPLSEENIWIGGEPRRDFVRIVIEQIARSLPAVPAGPDGESEEGQKAKAYRKGWMDRVNEVRSRCFSLGRELHRWGLRWGGAEMVRGVCVLTGLSRL
jgi:hypothetical protein